MRSALVKVVLAACVAVTAAMACAPAFAGGYAYRGGYVYRGGYYHGGGYYGPRVGVGVYVGAPFAWPGPYYYGAYPYPYPYAYPYGYPPAYYPPAVVGVPISPPTYVEQNPSGQAAPAQSADSWWYYCPSSEIYYPYVKECAQPWQRVPPQPPS